MTVTLGGSLMDWCLFGPKEPQRKPVDLLSQSKGRKNGEKKPPEMYNSRGCFTVCGWLSLSSAELYLSRPCDPGTQQSSTPVAVVGGVTFQLRSTLTGCKFHCLWRRQLLVSKLRGVSGRTLALCGFDSQWLTTPPLQPHQAQHRPAGARQPRGIFGHGHGGGLAAGHRHGEIQRQLHCRRLHNSRGRGPHDARVSVLFFWLQRF